MATIRISQLNEILTVTGDDFFPVSDSGSLTTYRASLATVGKYISESVPVGNATSSISASYALSASNAESASWAPSAAIGSVAIADSASWASASLQAAFATQSLNATQSLYATRSVYATQSLNATQSVYATQSLNATSSLTASYLTGSGIVTTLVASSSITLAQNAKFIIPIKSDTDWSNKTNCVFFQGGTNSGGSDPLKNDWGRLYFIEEIMNRGHIRFDHHDNADYPYPLGPNIDYQYVSKPGFLWSNWSYSTGNSSSLMFLSTNGELYVRKAEARDFTASAEGVGFHGTASWAENVSSMAGAGTAKAWAYVLVPSASLYNSDYDPNQMIIGNAINKPIIIQGYNVSDISWASSTIVPSKGFVFVPYPWSQSLAPDNGNSANFIVTMTNALPTASYGAIGSAGTQQVTDAGSVYIYPWGRRTTTKFTASVKGPHWPGSCDNVWFHFVVY